MKSRLSWLAIKATSIESKWKKFAFINHRENRWQSLTNYRAIRQKMTVKGRWSWRAPVVKHEKPACPRETGPRKGEEKRKTGGGPRLRPRTLDLVFCERNPLLRRGTPARLSGISRACTRTRLPILVLAYQPATTRNKGTSEPRVEGEPKRWKVARIFAARNIFCLQSGTLSSKIREKRNENVIKSVLILDRYIR